MISKEDVQKHYLVASDFDQTLSFNDSGIALSELLGISGFEERAAGLSRINLVQQGGELAYLLLQMNYNQHCRSAMIALSIWVMEARTYTSCYT